MRKISQTRWLRAPNFTLTRRCILASIAKLLKMLDCAASYNTKCTMGTSQHSSSSTRWHWPGHQPKATHRGSTTGVRAAKAFEEKKWWPSRPTCGQPAWWDHRIRAALCSSRRNPLAWWAPWVALWGALLVPPAEWQLFSIAFHLLTVFSPESSQDC